VNRPVKSESPRTGKIAVALADKNPLILRGLKSLLEEDDRFELAVAATDGERFLDAMARTGFEVAVIGWTMPYMSGREVLEKLGASPSRARIVIYTGDRRNACRLTGCYNNRSSRRAIIRSTAGGRASISKCDCRSSRCRILYSIKKCQKS